MDWPQGVLTVLAKLDRAGHQAWAVGGCVRDLMLGRAPHDWDVCTSATPQQMRLALDDLRLVETGLKHGTLTALTPMPVEVTTYRVDGPYLDHRRPQGVRFVDDLAQDLRRRDFTINAMALRPDRPVVDLFGGMEDLHRRVVRCVGDAHQRFGEDALRMLRCLRFAAQLDFAIDDDTAQALEQDWDALHFVSAERIGAECLRLILGPGAGRVLTAFRAQVTTVLPLRPVDLAPVDLLPPDTAARLGFALDDEQAPRRLRFDKRLCDRAALLMALRDAPTPQDAYAMLRLMNRAGAALTGSLIAIWRAQGRDTHRAQALMDQLLAQGACYRLSDLRVTGDDLTALGLRGAQVGQTLHYLLDQVMAGRLPNARDALLKAIAAR